MFSMPTSARFVSSRGAWPALFAAVLCALLLTACGFHLRGAGAGANLPFSSLFVRAADNSPLAIELKRYIAAGKTAVATDPKTAQGIIEILSENRDKQVLSLNSQGRVREFTLQYRVSFRVTDASNVQLLAPTQIAVRRIFNFNESQVLSKENEETMMFRDMQTDVVQQIIRRLAVIKPGQADTTPPAGQNEQAPQQAQ